MVAAGLLILAAGITWKREPLLVPLGFGCLLANLAFPYLGGLFSTLQTAGLATGLLPILALIGLGASLDLKLLLIRPRAILLSAVGQVGIFFVILLATFWKFGLGEAASIGIASAASAASGPLAVFTANRLAPHLLAPVALAGVIFATILPVARTGIPAPVGGEVSVESCRGESTNSASPTSTSAPAHPSDCWGEHLVSRRRSSGRCGNAGQSFGN